MTEASTTSETHKKSGGGVSRRTVARGAAVTAWAVPVVTLATAAPAFACSSNVSATLINPTLPAYAAGNPTVVNFTVRVANSGAPATSASMTVNVPAAAGHTSAPTFSNLSGWTKSGAAAAVNGWTQTYTRASLPTGSNDLVGTVIFGDTNASPYVRWNGLPFTLGGSITAANQCSNAFTPGGVAALPSTLAVTPALSSTGNEGNFVNRWQATTAPDDDPIGSHRRYFGATTVQNTGNSTIGPITAQVTMSKNTAGRWLLEPRIAVLHAGWSLSGTAHTAGSWVFNFTTVAAAFAPSTNGGTGPTGPATATSFTTPAQPYTAPSAQFAVLFWPNASAVDSTPTVGPGSGTAFAQNRFVGTITFASTSAGQALTLATYTRSDFNNSSTD